MTRRPAGPQADESARRASSLVMGERREMLILTRLMATVMVLELLGDPAAALRGLANAALLALAALVVLGARARGRRRGRAR